MRLDPRETMRAARALGDGMGMDERRRQRIGRLAFAEAMGETDRLVKCRACGLTADYVSPCTECQRYSRLPVFEGDT